MRHSLVHTTRKRSWPRMSAGHLPRWWLGVIWASTSCRHWMCKSRWNVCGAAQVMSHTSMQAQTLSQMNVSLVILAVAAGMFGMLTSSGSAQLRLQRCWLRGWVNATLRFMCTARSSMWFCFFGAQNQEDVCQAEEVQLPLVADEKIWQPGHHAEKTFV